MLQFITKDTNKYSAVELAQMAIEGGCSWICFNPAGHDRDIINQLIELCRESETILTFESDVELVNELKVTGVHLHKDDMSPEKAREMLGPHAIIGVDVDNPEKVILLKAADIDYVTVGPFGAKDNLETYKKFVDALVEKECAMPVVAFGEIEFDNVNELLETGVKGIAVDDVIALSDNPVIATQSLLAQSI